MGNYWFFSGREYTLGSLCFTNTVTDETQVGSVFSLVCVPRPRSLFLVFQVFVASPHKTQPIVEILLKNQPKLIEFLSTFQKERTDDEQFTDEKNYLIKQIRDLKKTTPWSPLNLVSRHSDCLTCSLCTKSIVSNSSHSGEGFGGACFLLQCIVQGRWDINIWMKKNELRLKHAS